MPPVRPSDLPIEVDANVAMLLLARPEKRGGPNSGGHLLRQVVPAAQTA
jgi:hypothetical protein